jgi:[acyl-carrier-protein] S-malonyltransferase
MLTSFIFPAFISEFSGNEAEILIKYSSDFEILLKEASDHLGIDLTAFDIRQNNFHDQELNAQFISFIFSCAVSDLFIKKQFTPDYISGYSMGLYAALYCGKAISFYYGLDLIGKAFELIKSTQSEIEKGMGSIVGLTANEIEILLHDFKHVTLVNSNGIHSHQVSGYYEELNQVLDLAKTDGALHTSLMNVSCPYHTSLLDEASMSFKDYVLEENLIKDSVFKLVSGIDQRIFSGKEDIIHELSANLNSKINWLKTMEKLLNLRVTRFMECGAGTSLLKIGKFIKGEFVIYPVNKLDKLFGDL